MSDGDDELRAAEEALFAKMDLDGQDTRVCSMLIVWVLEILREELVTKAKKPMPVYQRITADVACIGDSVKRLFTYQYQVLPR